MILSCDSKGKRVVIKTALATVVRPTGHSLVFLGHLQAPSFFTCDTSLNFDSGERRCVPNHKRPRTRRRKTSITRSQGPCTLSFPCLHHTYFFFVYKHWCVALVSYFLCGWSLFVCNVYFSFLFVVFAWWHASPGDFFVSLRFIW